MPGPYFSGQQTSSPCGCYYPDVTRLGDNKITFQRTLHCVFHGQQVVPIDGREGCVYTFDQAIPTEDWREAERVRLRLNTTLPKTLERSGWICDGCKDREDQDTHRCKREQPRLLRQRKVVFCDCECTLPF